MNLSSRRHKLAEKIASSEFNVYFRVFVMVSIFLLAGAFGLAFSKVENISREEAHKKAIIADLHSCHRGNVALASNNYAALRNYQSGVAVYKFDILFINLIEAGLKKQTNSAPRTKEQEKATQLFISKLTGVAISQRSAYQAQQWIPLTKCSEAILKETFPVPVPVRFDDRLPPKQAITIPPISDPNF